MRMPQIEVGIDLRKTQRTEVVELLSLAARPRLVRVLSDSLSHLQHGSRQVDRAQVGRTRVVVSLRRRRKVKLCGDVMEFDRARVVAVLRKRSRCA